MALVVVGCGSGASNGPSASSSAAPAGGAAGAASASAAVSGGSASTSIGQELEQEFTAVVGRVSPSVVVIQTTSGLGSGVVFDAQGDIVTNAHVVGTSTKFVVTTPDGRQLDAKLVGSFPPDDLAVVRASGPGLAPASFGDSSKLTVGTIVLAIGNPLGLQSSVTEGIVSALGRTVTEPGGAAIPGAIQTSASINPGNSGGALVDLDGAVIGIPTLTAIDPEIGGQAPGIGFAIPSAIVTDIASQLVQHGHVVSSHRAYLGVRAASVRNAPGVLIFAVDPGSPADKAGLVVGEVITDIAGKPTPDPAALAAVLATLAPGQTVPVSVVKPDGSTAKVDVQLGELPGS
jgi:S1-C subfamily serine protease